MNQENENPAPEAARDERPDDLVWYACYGSNLCFERFMCYLEGGKAPGAQRKNKGARDPSEPYEERAVFLPHALYFSQHSIVWQKGGVAFVDPRRNDEQQTWGRAYLITREQFEDVFRQENSSQELMVDWDTLLDSGSFTSGDRWYNHIVQTGELDGYPIFTMTNATNPTERKSNAPSAKYLQCIIDGIHETYCMGKEGTRKYLKDIPGIKGAFSGGQIAKMWQKTIDEANPDTDEEIELHPDYYDDDDEIKPESGNKDSQNLN